MLFEGTFNTVRSKISQFGEELTLYHTIPKLDEYLKVTSIFSFFHTVFKPFTDKSFNFCHIHYVTCNSMGECNTILSAYTKCFQSILVPSFVERLQVEPNGITLRQ